MTRVLTALAVLTIAGCGGPDVCPVLRNPEPASPRRDTCLAPPWVPPEGATVAGFTREATSPDGREQRWMRDAPREPMPAEVGALLEQHSREWMEALALEQSGFGTCGDLPGAAMPILCIRVALWICGTKITDVLERIGAAIATGPLADARVRVLINLAGAMGPRCAATDATCTPTPYSGSLADSGYSCTDDRIPASVAFDHDYSRLSGGACRHDGECTIMGCGNHCLSWDTRMGAGTCEAYTQFEDTPALCGCVGNECTWFVAD